ncbi:hypothetical protein KIPB_009261 [Kipferlia bialata]|uniref:Uncharacterized protein n=1 Tax=Kipferlia bialata TaxID=797122 RepID=A0A9K3D4T0_9EUKA|nr:hypothetical protein KIPB_009261 [Kipferlia bialata]|eukprot:g9261.t1
MYSVPLPTRGTRSRSRGGSRGEGRRRQKPRPAWNSDRTDLSQLKLSQMEVTRMRQQRRPRPSTSEPVLGDRHLSSPPQRERERQRQRQRKQTGASTPTKGKGKGMGGGEGASPVTESASLGLGGRLSPTVDREGEGSMDRGGREDERASQSGVDRDIDGDGSEQGEVSVPGIDPQIVEAITQQLDKVTSICGALSDSVQGLHARLDSAEGQVEAVSASCAHALDRAQLMGRTVSAETIDTQVQWTRYDREGTKGSQALLRALSAVQDQELLMGWVSSVQID